MMVLQISPDTGYWLQQSLLVIAALAALWWAIKRMDKLEAEIKGLNEARINELKSTSVVLTRTNDVMKDVLDTSKNLPEDVRREVSEIRNTIIEKSGTTQGLLNKIIDKI